MTKCADEMSVKCLTPSRYSMNDSYDNIILMPREVGGGVWVAKTGSMIIACF